ncbi:MAG: DUF4199 domain-containing protein [Bacteroidia bacterium]
MEFQEGNIAEKPAGYSQRLKQSILAWSKKPSVFHGLLTGVLLFVSKFVFYLSNNWEFIFEPSWMFFSFLIMGIAMFMAQRVEKQGEVHYNYKQALFTCSRIVFISIFMSVFADFVLYYIVDGSLASQTLKIQIDKTILAFNELPVDMGDTDKDRIIEELRKSNPAALSSLFSNVFSKVLMNELLVLIIALFFRQRRDSNQWLKD